MPLTLRLVKGSELTYAELDGNFTFITGSYTPLSVTSSMSVATASNVTPAIANNAADRIITSDGDGTFTAEANFTFNGTNAILSGSLTITGSSALIGNSTITGNETLTGGINAAGGFTGSLQGTASVANNIAPTIASDGVNRVLTSDGDGTMTAEANLTFDGTALVVTGSLTISGSGTLTNIGPARFRSGIPNSATVTALEITGGLQVTGSIDSVNRNLYNSSSVVTVEWENGKLNHPSYGTAVNWKSYLLKRSSGVTTIDWDTTNLYDYSGGVASYWGGRILSDTSGITSIHWGDRYVTYPSGYTALDWGTNNRISASGSVLVTGSLTISGSNAFTLTNIGPAKFRSNIANSATINALEITGSAGVSGSTFTIDPGTFIVRSKNGTLTFDNINSFTRVLKDFIGSSSIGYQSRQLYYIDGTTPSVDWGGSALNNPSNITTVDWKNNTLADDTGVLAATWQSRALTDSAAVTSVDWESRTLGDISNVTSFDWDTRRMYYNNGITAMSLVNQNIQFLNVSQSFMISASVAPNATASLGIVADSAADNWYNIKLNTQKSGVSSSIEVNKYITLSHGAGGSIQLLGDTYFNPTQVVRIYNNSSNTSTFQIDPATSIANTVNISGVTKIANNLHVTGSVNATATNTGNMSLRMISGSGATVTTASILVSSNHNTENIGGVLLSSYIGTQGSYVSVGKGVSLNSATNMIVTANNGLTITGSSNTSVLTYMTSSYFAPTTFNNQVTVVGSPAYVVLTTVSQSLNFANDTAAAAAGVPLGGLYRNGSFIMIRMS